MIRGTELTLADGKVYTFAPLTLGVLEDYAEKLETLEASSLSKESVSTVIDIAFHSLKRNYRDIARDQVRDLIDLGLMGPVLAATMNASGISEKGAVPGEAKVATRKPRRR